MAEPENPPAAAPGRAEDAPPRPVEGAPSAPAPGAVGAPAGAPAAPVAPGGAPAVEAGPTRSGIRLTPEQLLFFNRQLASMARLNMPIARGLKVMGEEIRDEAFRRLILGVQQDLAEGKSLEEALSRYPSSFNRIYIELLRAGEATGNLAVVLDQISEYSETMFDVRSKIRDALAYPMVLGSVTLAFVLYFFIFAIPNFQLAFENLAQVSRSEIPLLTRIMIHISEFVRSPLLSVPTLGVLFAFAGYLVARIWRGVESYDQFLLGLPLFGQLFYKATIHKMCRTLRDLMVNGVSLVQALDLTSRVVGANRIQARLVAMRDEVEEGKDFSEVLAGCRKDLPQTTIWKLQMGHERGVIEETFGELAREYAREIDSLTAMIVRVMGPVLLIFISAVVGLLFASFYPPLLKVMSSAR